MKITTVLVAIIASFSLLHAQQPLKPVDPPELVERKAEHIRAMNRAQIIPLTSYLQALTVLRQQYVREAKPDAIASVDAEINRANAELNAANEGSNVTTAAATQLQIDQAVFGDLLRNKVEDVTNYFRNALARGQQTISVTGPDMLGAIDPAPNVHKSTRITYTVNGKRKIKEWKDIPGAVVDVKKDLR